MMKKSAKPSDGEMEILQIIWELGAPSIREIHDALQKVKESGYTTTLKQVQRMVEKGFIKKIEDQTPQRFTALIKEQVVKKQMVKRLANHLFKGSSFKMALHALGNAETSKEELEEIKKWLEEKERSLK